MKYLNTACWVKISADDILKHFSYFPQKTDFDISCNLHEMSKPVLGEKKEYIKLCSAELVQTVVNIKYSDNITHHHIHLKI